MNTKAPFAAEACLLEYMWWAVDMRRDHIVLGSNLFPPTGPNPTQVLVAPTKRMPVATSVPFVPHLQTALRVNIAGGSLPTTVGARLNLRNAIKYLREVG